MFWAWADWFGACARVVLGLGVMGFGIWFWGVMVGQVGFAGWWVGFWGQVCCIGAWGVMFGGWKVVLGLCGVVLGGFGTVRGGFEGRIWGVWRWVRAGQGGFTG